MAQETVTEFKTVEEKKTRTLCDNCSRTEEEAQILTVAINPKVERESWEDVELIETYEDSTVAERELNNFKLAKAHDTMNYGIGRVTHNHHKDMRASAKADVCSQCVFDLFGIEIPEDEEEEEIELDDGELIINTTKEVTSVWPQFDIPEYTDYRNEIGWKGKILLWPMPFIICLWEVLGPTNVQSGIEERQEGYIAGSIGALVWASILFAVLYFSSILVFVV